jgi:endonuclease V-like protein UPF0215 family
VFCNVKVSCPLEGPHVDGKIILKGILRKYVGSEGNERSSSLKGQEFVRKLTISFLRMILFHGISYYNTFNIIMFQEVPRRTNRLPSFRYKLII